MTTDPAIIDRATYDKFMWEIEPSFFDGFGNLATSPRGITLIAQTFYENLKAGNHSREFPLCHYLA